MFDKAFSNNTMDYELIFWGYTFSITGEKGEKEKKIIINSELKVQI